MKLEDDASAELRSPFVLNLDCNLPCLVANSPPGQAQSNMGGNMLFNGLLRLYCGKLSGPRESGSLSVLGKVPTALNVPTGCCNSGERP